MSDQHGTLRERASTERRRAVGLRKRSEQLRGELEAGIDKAVDGLRGRQGLPLGARGDRFALRMPRLASFVAVARHDFTRWLERQGVRPEDVMDIVLALSEACANAVEHPEAASQPAFEVSAVREGRDVLITIKDFGRWAPSKPMEPGASSGRGLQMMRTVMDDVDVTEDEGGTTIVLRRRLGQAKTASAAM